MQKRENVVPASSRFFFSLWRDKALRSAAHCALSLSRSASRGKREKTGISSRRAEAREEQAKVQDWKVILLRGKKRRVKRAGATAIVGVSCARRAQQNPSVHTRWARTNTKTEEIKKQRSEEGEISRRQRQSQSEYQQMDEEKEDKEPRKTRGESVCLRLS